MGKPARVGHPCPRKTRAKRGSIQKRSIVSECMPRWIWEGKQRRVVLLTSLLELNTEAPMLGSAKLTQKPLPGVIDQTDATGRIAWSSSKGGVGSRIKLERRAMTRPEGANHHRCSVQRDADGLSLLLFGIPRR